MKTVPFAVGATLSLGLAAVAGAGPVVLPPTTELQKYLIVGNKSSSRGDAVNVQNTELGADRKFLSDGNSAPNTAAEGGPNTRDVFKPGERWPASSSPQNPPPPAHGIFEGIDWSGDVALTSPTGRFSMSDVDVYAQLGVVCATSTEAACVQSVSNTFFFPDQVLGPGSPPGSLLGADPLVGVSLYDPTSLEAEMVLWQAFILGLASDATLTSNIENQNSKDGSGPLVTDLDALDAAGNGDGIAVIDIDVGNNDFLVNNSDWILQGSEDRLAIFRIQGNSNFLLSNSSILLGDGGIGGGANGFISDLGAIFYVSDPFDSSDQVANFNNVILNGIGIWDFTAVSPNGVNHTVGTEININDGQGCAQFIGSGVIFNDVRWNRCSFAPLQVPEPSSLLIFLAGALGIHWTRPRRKSS
jgi:hypothetical protein